MTNRKGYICFNNSTIEVEVAKTQEEMSVGLMNRLNLSENGGMIFIFDDNRVHKIWMKNMLMSLDVIWLDDNGKIVHIDKNMTPCEGYCKPFGPGSYSKFALELIGGYTDKYDINVGDIVRMIL